MRSSRLLRRRPAAAEPQLFLETNAATEAALDELRHQLAARDRENDDLTGQLRAAVSRAVVAEKRAVQAEQLLAVKQEALNATRKELVCLRDDTQRTRDLAGRAQAIRDDRDALDRANGRLVERIRGLETTVRAAADRIAVLTAEVEALRGPRPVAVTLVDGDAADGAGLLVPWQRQD